MQIAELDNRNLKMTSTIVHRLPVDGQAWLNCHIEGISEPVDVDAFDAALEVPAEAASPLLTNPPIQTTSPPKNRWCSPALVADGRHVQTDVLRRKLSSPECRRSDATKLRQSVKHSAAMPNGRVVSAARRGAYKAALIRDSRQKTRDRIGQ